MYSECFLKHILRDTHEEALSGGRAKEVIGGKTAVVTLLLPPRRSFRAPCQLYDSQQ